MLNNSPQYNTINNRKIADYLLDYFSLEKSTIEKKSENYTDEERDRARTIDFGDGPRLFMAKTVINFIADRNIEPNIVTLSYDRICKKLVDEGLLVEMDKVRYSLFSLGAYITTHEYSREIAEYGGYTMLVEGFPAIRDAFFESVSRIDTMNLEEDGGFGTIFYIGNNLFVTARHVIQKGNRFKFSIRSEPAVIEDIIVSDDSKLDLAIIKVKESVSIRNLEFFRIGKGKPLDRIIAMGYPSIVGAANSVLITTAGEISGTDFNILDRRNMHIISAKIKGGNSGGPIVNSVGQVVGVVTSDEIDPVNQADAFGTAIPSEEIEKLLSHTECVKITPNYDSEWYSIPHNQI